MVKWVKIKLSRPHRRKKHDVKGYTQKTSKPHRNQGHKRRARRTDAQIKAAEKRRKKDKKPKKQKKQKTLSQTSKGTPKKYFKQVEKNQSKIKTKGK